MNNNKKYIMVALGALVLWMVTKKKAPKTIVKSNDGPIIADSNGGVYNQEPIEPSSETSSTEPIGPIKRAYERGGVYNQKPIEPSVKKASTQSDKHNVYFG